MSGLDTPPEMIFRALLTVAGMIGLCAVVGVRAPPGPFRTNFWRRFKTLMLLTLLFVGAAIVGGLAWTLLFTLLFAVAQWELLSAFGSWEHRRPEALLTLITGAALPLAAHFYGVAGLGLAGIGALLSLGAAAVLTASSGPRVLAHAGVLAYVGGLGGFIVLLEAREGFPGAMTFLALVMLADLGAYLVGKRFGRARLAPGLSPGKTWEGLAGGVGFAMVGALLFGFLLPELGLGQLFACGFAVALGGLLGDLFASMLKRSRSLDDFSTLLPGHGGVLDRFDSYLMVGPLAWWAFAGPSLGALCAAILALALTTVALVKVASHWLDRSPTKRGRGQGGGKGASS